MPGCTGQKEKEEAQGAETEVEDEETGFSWWNGTRRTTEPERLREGEDDTCATS